MTTALLFLALLAQASSAREELREVSAALRGADGRPVVGLQSSELALVENGVARSITRFEPDDRGLTLALVVDTSSAQEGVARLNIVEAVRGLLRRMPEGSEFTIWGTSDRPTRLANWTSSADDAVAALERAHPVGNDTLIDALAESAADLRRREGRRRVLIAICGPGPDESHRSREAAIDETSAAAPMVLAVEAVGELNADVQASDDRGYVLGRLTQESGGRLERVLTPMAIGSALAELETHLRSLYRVVYASPSGLKRHRVKLEISRPGVRAALGESQRVAAE